MENLEIKEKNHLKVLKLFEQEYGTQKIREIAEKYHWNKKKNLAEILSYLSKPNNYERLKIIFQVRIFHNRGLRPFLKEKQLLDDRHNVFLESLVSLGLLRVERYYSPFVRNCKVFIYSLLSVPETERAKKLEIFLSHFGLEFYRKYGRKLIEIKSSEIREKNNDYSYTVRKLKQLLTKGKK